METHGFPFGNLLSWWVFHIFLYAYRSSSTISQGAPPIFFSMFIPSSIHMKQPHSVCFYTLLFIMVSGSGLQNSSTMNGGRIHPNVSKAIMHHQYFDGFNLWFYSPKYHLCLYQYQQGGYLISIPSSMII